MDEGAVRKAAFAMPLNNPSYTPGPYRFLDREYMIIAYQTDIDALKRVVPEPLEVVEPIRQVRIHPHARQHRVRRLHRVGSGDSGSTAWRNGWLRPRDVPQRPSARCRRTRTLGFPEEAREPEARSRPRHLGGHTGLRARADCD